jgi:putative Ca2+/H+ antiporter (TMEM165/GDT1 family)
MCAVSPSIFAFDPALAAAVFGVVFVAELPDKTAVAALILATRRRPLAVFLGAAGAFVAQSLVAVSFGSLLGLLPRSWVRIGAGLLFLGFAWAMWRRKDEEPSDAALRDGDGFLREAAASFLVIFIAEWGDLTQLATAALAAKHGRPLTVFVGATTALWAVTAIAVAAGHHLKARIDSRRLQTAAAVVFALVGAYFLLNPGS